MKQTKEDKKEGGVQQFVKMVARTTIDAVKGEDIVSEAEFNDVRDKMLKEIREEAIQAERQRILEGLKPKETTWCFGNDQKLWVSYSEVKELINKQQ